jgi:hypothetical protein
MGFCGYLKQSTAVDVLLGPFIDDTDGKTAETGLTLDVEVSKNGQALANKNDVTAPTHDAAGTVDGYYNCTRCGGDCRRLLQLRAGRHRHGHAGHSVRGRTCGGVSARPPDLSDRHS